MPLHEPPWDPHRVPGKPADVEERKDEDLQDFFNTFSMVIEEARRMLIEEALDQNINRPHHLESAIISLQDAAKLDEVVQIVRNLYLGEELEPVQDNQYPQDF